MQNIKNAIANPYTVDIAEPVKNNAKEFYLKHLERIIKYCLNNPLNDVEIDEDTVVVKWKIEIVDADMTASTLENTLDAVGFNDAKVEILKHEDSFYYYHITYIAYKHKLYQKNKIEER